jgi:hypothetical protein
MELIETMPEPAIAAIFAQYQSDENDVETVIEMIVDAHDDGAQMTRHDAISVLGQVIRHFDGETDITDDDDDDTDDTDVNDDVDFDNDIVPLDALEGNNDSDDDGA